MYTSAKGGHHPLPRRTFLAPLITPARTKGEGVSSNASWRSVHLGLVSLPATDGRRIACPRDPNAFNGCVYILCPSSVPSLHQLLVSPLHRSLPP
jgi:hypothetical protein